jgi:hypothetical protein
MALLSRLTMPTVTTLHTVLFGPTPVQRRPGSDHRRVVEGRRHGREKGRELLRTLYRMPAEKIEVIPHGLPDFPFVEPDKRWP